jgi:single-strand DNA-binding protein
MGVNVVHLVGRLGQDPELRYTQGGTPVGNFSLATGRKWKDKEGKINEETEWHKVVVWNKQAENCKEYLGKGSQAYVQGRLQTRKWEDKDGKDRWTTEVVANYVEFLDSKGDRGGGGRGGAPPPGDGDAPNDVDDSDIPF